MQNNPDLRDRFVPFTERLRAEGREQGLEQELEGLRHALRGVLSARELAIPADLESRLAGANRDQLQAWIVQASTVAAGEDPFER